MNRRTKIIVSVSGIFIVALALIGLTYAYFLTRINGNTNAKSISVSTAKLELTYSDNSSEILGSGKVLQPSSEPIGTKTFTVTNNGENTDYSVIIENVVVKNGTTNAITTFESNDLRYELTCTSSKGTSCNGTDEQKVFPLTGGVLVINDIVKGETQTYSLKMYYLETEKDQSNDMNKVLSAKINISRSNTYARNTLAYNIINNSALNKNGTKLVNHHTNFTKTANELAISTDNNGTSYYYRGKVTDNYLEFNNMCWRIVRIEGDGSIKITLAKENLCSTITSSDINSALINNGEAVIFGYTLENNDYIYNYENYNGGLYTKLNEWYNNNIKSKESYIKNDTWCLGGNKNYRYDWDGNEPTDTYWYVYKIATRVDGADMKQTDFTCLEEMDTVQSYVGTLSAEEEMLSGEVVTNVGNYTYLLDNVNEWYWTLSMESFSKYSEIGHDFVYIASGVLDYLEVNRNSYSGNDGEPIGIRPAITLKSGVILDSGDGTQTNPYKIVEN